MSDVENTERWAVSFRSLGETNCNTEACPDPDRLWVAASGGATASERFTIVEHTATCPACAEDWRIAGSLVNSSTAVAVNDGPGLPRLSSRPKTRWLWASAAAVATGMAAGFVLLVHPIMQDAKPTAVLRGDAAADMGSVAGYVFRDLRFDWPDSDAGTEYELWIVDSGFTPIATIEGLEESSYEVPSKLAEGLRRHQTFYWQVKSLRPNGRTAMSPTIIASFDDR